MNNSNKDQLPSEYRFVELPHDEFQKRWSEWGEKIFSSSNQTNGWDGKFKGVLCEIGTYIYHLNYDKPNGEHKSRQGHVNLIATY